MANPTEAAATVAALHNAVDAIVSSSGATGAINVKNAPYNAKGDNSDDTVALQAAANAAATAKTALYFPPGQYRVTQNLKIPSLGGQNFFNILGHGYVQTVIRCDIADPNSIGVSILDWKHSHMEGLGVFNLRPRDQRFGIAFGGDGNGTQSGQATIERVLVDGFNVGMSTTGAGAGSGNTSSEICFNTVVLQNNNTGFFNNSFNGLNFFFLNLMTSNNGTGIHAATSGVHVLGGAGATNNIDFVFSNGGTSTVQNFRAEQIGSLFLVDTATRSTIKNCVANKVIPNTEIVQGADLIVENSILNGYITATNNKGVITLLHNDIADPANDAVFDNPTSSHSMGPGYHSIHATYFNSFGNIRWDVTNANNSKRFHSGIGYIHPTTRIATYDAKLTQA